MRGRRFGMGGGKSWDGMLGEEGVRCVVRFERVCSFALFDGPDTLRFDYFLLMGVHD